MPEEGIRLRPHSEFMTAEEVMKIAKVFVSLGVNKIRLTGGEPLVRRDAKKIIKKLSELPVELAITTNGILIDDYISTFKVCGIKSVNVSLDTLKKERSNFITRRDYFDKVISNINLLLKENFHVKINVVVTKAVNDDEICDFAEWTHNKNIHVRFIEFMPFDGNKWEWNRGVSFIELISKIKNHFGENILKLNDGNNDTSKNFSIRNYLGTFAIISSITNPFCNSCNRMRLTADGKMKNCLFSETETDLLSAIRNDEDIVPMILETMWKKKSLRGGINNNWDFSKQKNRTMVAIGG